MTKDNARLRRQALILSYLPDPVIAITTSGEITFCSMQVERVLHHKMSDLLGASIEQIIVPSSRDAIRRLVRDLVVAEQQAHQASVGDGAEEAAENGQGEENGASGSSGGGGVERRSGNSSNANIISEQSSELSFPLLEVKVKAGQTSTEVAAGEDVSDSSGDPPIKNEKQRSNDASPTEVSSLTNQKSSFGTENTCTGEENCPTLSKKVKIVKTAEKTKSPGESDESTSSNNLTKNVELCKLKGTEQVRFSHKDDVMGASVTANNADAKLSSLMHYETEENNLPVKEEQLVQKQKAEDQPSIRRKHVLASGSEKQEERSSSSAESSLSKTSKAKKRSGNSSDDSGYRESNESPEESNEFSEDSSSSSASFENASKKKG